MQQSTRLVSGVPAYTWALATVLAAVLAAVGFVSLIGTLLALASGATTGLDAAILPVVVLFLGLVGLPLCRVALPRVMARETAAGYTTVPFFSGELPLVDPRDGRELIAAGALVPRSYRVSLRPARRHALV
ncbi:hypothetical protein GCM10025867_44800 [Frondihabitans sucicola]|uniref:Uncharacterized protein n=1 Tax=Frondihabitans sucicola TaxID=1268041 RepID=A0ABN6Y586_9MICO|nr:hypothetical protein [Frondihabitans sucicola]BDZ47765.1 hypothetical protein GCM10025867_00060 [Frondihabitans sucicola]BDZ52239.1 hypothetical protein GCM10025867_44800 [Frondihabitans sucicola]